MDFHSLSRRVLQALCKKNKIPANITNVAMADALAALESVEGLEELMNQTDVELLKTPGKSLTATASVARTSTRRRAVKEESESSKMTTRTQRGTRAAIKETIEHETEATGRKALAHSTQRKVGSSQVKEESKTAVMKSYATRRSTRLLEKKMDELSLNEKEIEISVESSVGKELQRGFSNNMENSDALFLSPEDKVIVDETEAGKEVMDEHEGPRVVMGQTVDGALTDDKVLMENDLLKSINTVEAKTDSSDCTLDEEAEKSELDNGCQGYDGHIIPRGADERLIDEISTGEVQQEEKVMVDVTVNEQMNLGSTRDAKEEPMVISGNDTILVSSKTYEETYHHINSEKLDDIAAKEETVEDGIPMSDTELGVTSELDTIKEMADNLSDMGMIGAADSNPAAPSYMPLAEGSMIVLLEEATHCNGSKKFDEIVSEEEKLDENDYRMRETEMEFTSEVDPTNEIVEGLSLMGFIGKPDAPLSHIAAPTNAPEEKTDEIVDDVSLMSFNGKPDASVLHIAAPTDAAEEKTDEIVDDVSLMSFIVKPDAPMSHTAAPTDAVEEKTGCSTDEGHEKGLEEEEKDSVVSLNEWTSSTKEDAHEFVAEEDDEFSFISDKDFDEAENSKTMTLEETSLAVNPTSSSLFSATSPVMPRDFENRVSFVSDNKENTEAVASKAEILLADGNVPDALRGTPIEKKSLRKLKKMYKQMVIGGKKKTALEPRVENCMVAGECTKST